MPPSCPLVFLKHQDAKLRIVCGSVLTTHQQSGRNVVAVFNDLNKSSVSRKHKSRCFACVLTYIIMFLCTVLPLYDRGQHPLLFWRNILHFSVYPQVSRFFLSISPPEASYLTRLEQRCRNRSSRHMLLVICGKWEKHVAGQLSANKSVMTRNPRKTKKKQLPWDGPFVARSGKSIFEILLSSQIWLHFAWG